MPQHLNANDFRQAAKRRLPKALFEYIDRGTEDERALARLRESLDAIEMVPSVFTGHQKRDLRTEILGREQAMPLIVAPTALAGLVSYQGEVKIARAASRLGIPVCVSTQSVATVEEVAAGAPGADIWFQLYMWKDRGLSKALLERVAAAGVKDLVITADTPASPKRESASGDRRKQQFTFLSRPRHTLTSRREDLRTDAIGQTGIEGRRWRIFQR